MTHSRNPLASPARSAAWAGLVSLTLLVGCASQDANFRPLEAPEDVPAEMAAAYYDLQAAGRGLGEVKVWSRGVEERQDDQQTIHIGLRVRNDGDSPLRLAVDDTQLELLTGGETALQQRPVYSTGVEPVPPGEVGRMNLWYAIPEGVKVRDLLGVELVWAVQSEDGVVISRSTAFQRTRDRRYYRPYTPYYYDPFYSPYTYPGSRWSVGFGTYHRF